MLAKFFLTLALLASTSIAFAGGEIGGGGDAVRLDIVAVRNFIYENCSRWRTLKTKQIDIEKLRAKMDDVGTESRLKIVDEPAPEGKAVPWAISAPGGNEITFNRQVWLRTETGTILKVAILMHHFLVLMGTESEDDYQVTHPLIAELRFLAIDQQLEYTAPTRFQYRGIYTQERLTGRRVRLKNLRFMVDSDPVPYVVHLGGRHDLDTQGKLEFSKKLCKMFGFSTGIAYLPKLDEQVLKSKTRRRAVEVHPTQAPRAHLDGFAPVVLDELMCSE